MRLRSNFLNGTVENNFTVGATALVSADLVDMPVVASPDVMVVVVDPGEKGGAPEILHVTAHASGSNQATVLRGQEDTTARGHAPGTVWVHSATVEDFAQDTGGEIVPGPHDDEFDDEAIAPAWVRVDSTAAYLTWTEKKGVLSAHYAVGALGTEASANVHGLLKPMGDLAIGDELETCVSYVSPPTLNPKVGLMLTDGVTVGAGMQVMGALGLTTSAPYRFIAQRTQYGFNTSPSEASVFIAGGGGEPLYLRLRWEAANTFRMGYSPDGVSWLYYLSNRTHPGNLTPTHMGLYVHGSTAQDHVFTFHYFRVIQP